jgi:heme exporter protein A
VGKTSFLRMLAGLATPEEGTLTWAGRPLRGNEEWRRASVYVAHTNALKDDLTLAEALAFLAALAGQPADDAAVARAIEAMGLARQRNAPVRTLSQGQRRRGALARLALDDAPRVWVLDEPHDALDVDSVARLDALLVAHAARGGRVLLTSHQALAIPGLRQFDLSPYAVPDSRGKKAVPA